MPHRSHLVDDLPRIFRGSDAVAHGALTRAQLRGPAVQRVVRGVYTRPGVRSTHLLRCEATGLLLPPDALLTGRSAATVRGVDLARWEDPVEVLVQEGTSRELPRGVVVRRATRMPAGDPWSTTALAPPLRMAFDLASRAQLPVAVSYLDAVVRAGLVDRAALGRWLDDVHDPGVRAARRAAELCDPRAESLPESVLRVACVLAGIRVVPQVVVRDRGRVVARVDLAVEGIRVAVEYDGGWHALREQLEVDRQRMRDLGEAGWEVVHVTASMLARPDEVVAAIRGAVQRASR
ncbi:endonuclease domain-containing protein [Kineococcus glutinatus]|uniref:DUF559 domain-containing protein n=1 Tax=Kineococcus glutinatus TaxID=1070872 RepID=A0ABP9HBW1_9ACTN